MKKAAVIVLASSLMLASTAYGANTFPASGDVGIGTASPTRDLNQATQLSDSLTFVPFTVLAPSRSSEALQQALSTHL
jgi:hypothetical protein